MTKFDTTTPSAATRHGSAFLKELRAFRNEEDGALAKMAIVVLFLMLMVGGIGIDLMRYERERTVLQYTLDRAVLAAADLDQPLAPDEVVEDYLTKAGLASHYTTPDFDIGAGFRWVEAEISAPFSNQFMADSHVFQLNALARAEERIDDIEISVVLDVSGSMNSYSRLPRLKTAAKEFVDTMVAQTETDKMSMSIIPYATQVSLPDTLYSRLNVSSVQPYSNCVHFAKDDFDETGISSTTPLTGTMHFSPWSSSDRRNDPSRLVPKPVCEDAASRELLVMEQDPDTLKDFITNLSARGNTSLDLGMKWGTALLDPELQPVIQAMATEAIPEVDPAFSARPVPYSKSDTMKIVVLMTDGQNTSQYYINDSYRTALSGVWYNAAEHRYSTYDPASGQYYWDGFDHWDDHPYGNGSYYPCGTSSGCSAVSEPGSAVQLSFAELWANTSPAYVADKLYDDWMPVFTAWNEHYNKVFTAINHYEKDNRTKAICDAAKSEGIIVYTIGFEAPKAGQNVLKDCASSDSHFFDVEGLEISSAFRSIATSIRTLRLTK